MTKKITDPVILRLRSIARDSPGMKDAAQLYEAILPLQRDADLRVGAVSLTPLQVREKMGKGLPLLHDLDLELDVETVRGLMIGLADAIETVGRKNSWHRLRLPWLRASRDHDPASRRVRRVLEENRLDVGALLPHVAAGNAGAVACAAKDLKLDPGLLMTLAQNALKPALRAWRRQLSLPAQGVSWEKGACFVCGAAATLAELQENDQVKHLRCGSCGADWQVRRLRCIYCGNEDHNTLRYLYDERNREKMQIEVCDKCKGYLKVISAFTPAMDEMLVVEDLATLPLDYIAQGRGYARPAVQ